MQLTEEQELTMKMAEVGYSQYRNSAKSREGAGDLPEWRDLSGGLKNSWFSAADEMTKFLASLAPNLRRV